MQYNGSILFLIPNQPYDLCLAAVQQNGLTLEYVKEQTPEICMTAVSNNGLALAYVKSPDSIRFMTPESNREPVAYQSAAGNLQLPEMKDLISQRGGIVPPYVIPATDFHRSLDAVDPLTMEPVTVGSLFAFRTVYNGDTCACENEDACDCVYDTAPNESIDHAHGMKGWHPAWTVKWYPLASKASIDYMLRDIFSIAQ